MKEKAYIVTQLYRRADSNEMILNVVGVYTSQDTAKHIVAKLKGAALEEYKEKYGDEYEITKDIPTLFEIIRTE